MPSSLAMKTPPSRETTLHKIARSIEKAWTLEQLLSTEQFLLLYYRRFAFQSPYLRQEYRIDNHLREKKQHLTALEGAWSVTFDPRKPSLKRLEAYLQTFSQQEFEAEWEALRSGLAEVSMAEMSLYPLVCALTATLTFTAPKQRERTYFVGAAQLLEGESMQFT
jgi:hypothetical protein